jgi:hypothetical protein
MKKLMQQDFIQIVTDLNHVQTPSNDIKLGLLDFEGVFKCAHSLATAKKGFLVLYTNYDQ